MIYDTLRPLNPVDCRVPGYTGRTLSPKFTVLHHTASSPAGGDSPSLRICREGRPDLPGPLCQVLISRSGRIYVITDGYANHTGPTHPGYGNYNCVGVEIENNGRGEPYAAAALDAARQVCRLLGLPVVGHKEICSPPGRKIDPSFDMDAFRASLTLEDAMLTKEQNDKLDEIHRGVYRRDYDGDGKLDTPYLMDAVMSLKDQVAALQSAVQAGGGSVDVNALAKAVADELHRRMAQ